MIYDYGFAKKINSEVFDNYDIIKMKKEIYEDYRKIIHAFFNKKVKGWIKLPNLPDKNTNNLMTTISYELDKNIEFELTNNTEDSSVSYAGSIFTHIIEKMLLKYAPKGMLVTHRPLNVINDAPFIIGL